MKGVQTIVGGGGGDNGSEGGREIVSEGKGDGGGVELLVESISFSV
jgi:hypothetical protein